MSTTGERSGRRKERKALTKRRLLTAGLALTGAAAAAAITAGLLGFGTPPSYLEAPSVEKPFTPNDPDTYTGDHTPPELGPMELAVPSLGIRATVTDVGLEPGTNKMIIPTPEKVGHYTPAAPIGAGTGTTLLAGHVNNGTGPGALWNLSKAEKGTPVYITNHAGQRFTYTISASRTVTRQPLPQEAFAIEGPAQLVLVTCAGIPGSDGNVLNYTHNTIITATPTTRPSPERTP